MLYFPLSWWIFCFVLKFRLEFSTAAKGNFSQMWQKPKRHCSPQVFNHQGCSWGIVLETAGQAGILAFTDWEKLVVGEGELKIIKIWISSKENLIFHFTLLLFSVSLSPESVITLRCSTGVDGQLQYFPSALLPGPMDFFIKSCTTLLLV